MYDGVDDGEEGADEVVGHLGAILLELGIKLHHLGPAAECDDELGENLVTAPDMGLELHANFGDERELLEFLQAVTNCRCHGKWHGAGGRASNLVADERTREGVKGLSEGKSEREDESWGSDEGREEEGSYERFLSFYFYYFFILISRDGRW